LLPTAFIQRTDFFLFAAMLGLLKWHRLLMASRRIAASIFVLKLDDDIASDVWAEAKGIGGSQAS
jgi:hypothetical protein